MSGKAGIAGSFRVRRGGGIVLRIFVCLLAAVTLVVVAGALFVNLLPSFGGRADAADREEYARRAENYSDGQFHNTGTFSLFTNATDPYADRASAGSETPLKELPSKKPDFSDADPDGLSLTWFGHSTVLLQMEGKTLLFDPVLSEIASPVSFVGSRRFGKPAATAEELPAIDLVVLSHDHYDHLDYGTILAVDPKVKAYAVPLGVENHLERWGVDPNKIHTFAWWEEAEIEGIRIACLPSRHYSGRGLSDRNRTLWASWALLGGRFKVFESGDSGYGEHFRDIAEKYGAFDLALMDCAQYSTRWHEVHMFPEEAVQAAAELCAGCAVPIRFGAFSLSDHAWFDPPERFTRRAEEIGLAFMTPLLGETVSLADSFEHQTKWWREYA